MIGVNIEKGAKPWQIFQQVGGYASIQLSGTYEETLAEEEQVAMHALGYPEVYVRILREDTADHVIWWTQAELCREQKTWRIEFPRVPRGGLYRIESGLVEKPEQALEWAIRGDMVSHIGVGELFVIAGQSNSAGYGKDPVYDPPQMGVHLLKNNDVWDIASHPFNDSTDTRHPENLEMVNSGHSMYLEFGKYLMRELGCPVGFIQTALGGSPLSRWNPAQVGDLYRNMRERIRFAGGNVKAVLWYQGCSDTNETEAAETYLERFASMVTTLRRETGLSELPFYTFQIARYTIPPENASEDRNWSVVREAQRRAALMIPGVSILPTMDGMLSDLIHNAGAFNLVLGARLARQVLRKSFGKELPDETIDLVRAEITGNQTIVLTFGPIHGHLYAFDVMAENLPFVIMDESGRNEVSSYQLTNDKVILNCERDLKGDVIIECYSGQNPGGCVLIDYFHHCPVLGFTVTISKERPYAASQEKTK